MAKKPTKPPAPSSEAAPTADVEAKAPAGESPVATTEAPPATNGDADVLAGEPPVVASEAPSTADVEAELPPVEAELPPVEAELPPVEAGAAEPEASVDPRRAIEMLGDVELDVKIELGRCLMLVGDVLRLSAGSVVELDKLAGDPVDVYVNERLVARGEVLVVNDNFCVRINEVLAQDD